jgi:L-asparaginase II
LDHPTPEGTIDPAPLVAFTRGSSVESTHFGSIAIVDAEGQLIASVGDLERPTYMRSSAKPFQAMAFVETGAAAAFGVTPAELALIAASHSGEPRHTEAVRSLLERAGLTEEALLNGVHPPLHAPTRIALERAGEPPRPAHHNCSGKHCGMVCACVHQGWDLRTYIRPDHPLQRRVLSLIADVSAVARENISLAIDGCGVPTFGLPLSSFAQAFARLARAETLPDRHCGAAQTVRDAMLANPGMVAGEGRFDTRLMEAAGGRVLSKGGAEACQGLALLDRGWGIALKIEDGGARAVAVAAIEALRQLDALTERELEPLVEQARPPVRNYRDEIVGEARPLFTLQRVP